MHNTIMKIDIGKLKAHPENPNRMNDVTFNKLVRHIERTGFYEPVVVRCHGSDYQILNGHHRVKALKQLGRKKIDCVIWDVDDDRARVLLSTLNRLGGSDVFEKKAALLKDSLVI